MNRQSIASKNILATSQQEQFPYTIQQFGLELVVHKGVFSPKHFNGYKIFTKHFPSIQGEKVLEIGCGTGVTGLYLARNGAQQVVLTDINPKAVENTKVNAQKNNIKNCDVRESDVFSAIKQEEQFDTIYWNMPFMPAPKDYCFESMLERGLFDPGYNITRKFIQEAPNYLTSNGRVLIGWGDSEDREFGCPQTLSKIAQQYGFSITLLREEESTEEQPVRFQLYELKRLQK